MADEAHHKMSEDNPTRLRIIVCALAVIYVMIFLSGFLQETQYNYGTTLFFWVGVIGSLVLIRRPKGLDSSRS